MLIRPFARHVGLLLALVWLGPSTSPAQQVTGRIQIQPPVRDRPPMRGTAAVKGRVVDGATGTAVARARVTLQGSLGGRPPVVTDGTGGFAFTDLPAGIVALAVDKATYMTARYPEGGRTLRSANKPLMLRDGQVLDNVTVPIFHGAAITGRVFDQNGDPVDYAQVNVLRIPSPGRAGRPMQRGGTQTNDLGEYRVPRLDPGTYVLQVTARRGAMEMLSSAGAQTPAPAPQPLPTFYPSALAVDQAQQLTLERGQTLAGIDVMLAEGLPAVIIGTVTGVDGLPVAGNGYVNARRAASESLFGGFDGGGTGVRPDGTFRLTVPPGEYLIDVRMTPQPTNGPPTPENELSGTVRVSAAGGNEETVSVTVGRGATVTGRVVFEGAQPPPNPTGQVHVPFYSQDGNCRSAQAVVSQDWTFRIAGISGTCGAPPGGMFGRWTLKAVMHNGDNLLDEPFTFQPGQALRNVQVIVTDKRTDLTFRVADESGQSTREYVALVYPLDKTQWSQAARTFVPPPAEMLAFRAMPSGRMGAPGVPTPAALRPESMSGLRPGEYFVVAVDDMEPDDARDPVVLERLRSSGVRVTLIEGTTVDAALRRVKFADVMARQ